MGILRKFVDILQEIWSWSLVKAVVFLGIAFLAALVASVIAKKLFKLLKLDAKLDKWGINEGQSGTALTFIGKLTFLITFLLFIPTVFGALGLQAVANPITDFTSACLNYIPNIIAAVIVLFVGVFIARLLCQILVVFLAKTKIDSLTQKLGREVRLSLIIAKVVYAIVILVAIVQALTVLNVEAISAPALSIIDAIFGAIPSIILAAIVIACGVLVANIACSLLGNVLKGVDFDNLVAKFVPQVKGKFSPTKVVVNVVRTIILLFIVAQGIDILGLSILTGIMTAVIAYIPMLIKALVIAVVAFFGANLLEGAVNKAMPNNKFVGKLAKTLVFVFAAFMILSQLDFATTIVNSAFIIILCGIAVAFAIAFGIGGKDFAKKTLDNVKLPAKEDKPENNQ